LNRTASEERGAVAAADCPRSTIVAFGAAARTAGSGLAPDCVEDVARAVAAECVLEGADEVIARVEPEGCIGAVIGGALETGETTTARDDPGCPEELRRLHGNQADRPGRAEDEHVLAAGEGRSPRERQPPG
jgi:hypothetical protein